MAKLPSIIFLEKHFANGGVSQSGYEALKSVIGMISEMSWETHVIWEGKTATSVSKKLIEGHIVRILRVCSVFNKNMRNHLVIIESTANMLPDLKGLDTDDLDDSLITWRNKLRVLHVPNGNDKNLFKLILLQYDATVHQRLRTLHQYKPNYGLDSLGERCAELRRALNEIIQIAETADRVVRDLRAAFEASKHLLKIMQDTQRDWEEAVVSPGQSPLPASTKPLPPIPHTPQLKRCRTFISRETEVQDRMIRGQVISSRRPSIRGRAATVDDTTHGIEVWWRQQRPPESIQQPATPWIDNSGASRKKTF